MPHYKDTENKVHFLDDAAYVHFLPLGSVEITDEEAEQIKEQNKPPKTQEQINAEHHAYLASTDWYVVRFAETGVAIPADILAARQAARDAIV